MMKSVNVPKELQLIINRWNKEGKKYYLGPGNLWRYNNHKISYNGGEDIPDNGWFAQNGEDIEDYQLTRKDVEEIQNELLRFYKTTRWTLQLDYHCNYGCTMCPYHGDGVIDKEHYFEDRGGQMKVVSKEKAIERIDCLERYGIKTLSLMSYGEFILYPYWEEVSAYAKSKGMNLWTITNGSLWDEAMVKKAVSYGYTDIRVSLDALTFETYSKIRSKKRDFFEKAMQLPELLMKYGIKTNVHFVKQQENLHEVEGFIEYWKKKNVDSISVANEFCYDDELVKNKFAVSEKEYIAGLCTAFGNMQTLTDGITQCCCGTIPKKNMDEQPLEVKGCLNSVAEAIEDMRNDNSEFRKTCKKCALYVPYNDEEIVDGWKVVRNYERETWIKIAK